jgi:hypothetical protein
MRSVPTPPHPLKCHASRTRSSNVLNRSSGPLTNPTLLWQLAPQAAGPAATCGTPEKPITDVGRRVPQEGQCTHPHGGRGAKSGSTLTPTRSATRPRTTSRRVSVWTRRRSSGRRPHTGPVGAERSFPDRCSARPGKRATDNQTISLDMPSARTNYIQNGNKLNGFGGRDGVSRYPRGVRRPRPPGGREPA